MKNQEDIELINDYFHERLTPDAKNKFEDRWQNDDDFTQEIAFYLNLTKSVKTKHDADVQSFVKGAKEDYFRQRKRRRLLIGIGVALVSLFVGLFAWNWFNADVDDTKPPPTELENDKHIAYASSLLDDWARGEEYPTLGSEGTDKSMFLDAKQFLAKGDYEKAKRVLDVSKRAKEPESETNEYQIVYMEVELYLKEFENCLKRVELLKENKLSNVQKCRVDFITGRAYMGKGEFENAQTRFRNIIDYKLSPNTSEADRIQEAKASATEAINWLKVNTDLE